MSSLDHVAGSGEHELLAVQEATDYLRIGRPLGCQLAHEYLNSGARRGWRFSASGRSATGFPGGRSNLGRANHDIFEGTEQIQQLVISRAISGLRIE